MTFLKTTAIAAVMTVAGLGAASAATCTYEGKPSTTYTLDPASSVECVAGNDTNTIDASTELFGMTGWTLADKSDDGMDGILSGTFDGKSGTWAVDNTAGYENIILSLKAGPSYALFLLTDVLNGTWSISRDISHASVYTNGGGEPAPVPVPAAGFLLAGGLGALALRRRKNA